MRAPAPRALSPAREGPLERGSPQEAGTRRERAKLSQPGREGEARENFPAVPPPARRASHIPAPSCNPLVGAL